MPKTTAKQSPERTGLLTGLTYARSLYRYSSLRFSLTPIATSLLCRLALLDEASPVKRIIAGLASQEEGYNAINLLIANGLVTKEGRYVALLPAGRTAIATLVAQMPSI